MEKEEKILPCLFPSSSPGDRGIVSDIGVVSLFALMQKCKSKYQGQGDKGRAPIAVPMARQMVLGRLLDPSEPQLSLQPVCVFCLML